MVAIGWRKIIKRQTESHKRFMLTGAAFAILFFILYLSKTIFVGSTQFGGPDSLKAAYLVFLLFHIVLATVAAVFGIITISLAFKQRFLKHRKLGRITASIWFVTAVTGILVYTLLYVLYPGGEIGGLIDAII
jgi:putative membrane protein